MGVQSEEIELRVQKVWLESGIARIDVKPNAVLDIADAEASVHAVLRLGYGRRYPVLVDMREVKSMSPDARAFLGGPVPKRSQTAVAMVVGSRLSRAIGNFFLGINRPQLPTRLFNDFASAMEWLRAYPADA